MASDEKVLVFGRAVLDQVGAFQGLSFDHAPYLDAALSPANARFLSREKAEHDTSYKQVIPYVIVAHDDRVLFYVRGRQSGETRLVEKGSFGFGGHVRQQDDSLFSDHDRYVHELYAAALKREMHEELVFDTPYREHVVAVLNDDADAVGQVHFGVVHLWRVEQPKVTKRERKITQLAFLRPDELRAQPVELERWSAICLEHLSHIMRAGR